MVEAFRKIRDANSQRAPAAALKGAIDTVANPDMDPAARQSLLTSQLTNDLRKRDLYNDWTKTSEKSGVPVDYASFARKWKQQEGHSMNDYYQRAKQEVGTFKGVSPESKKLQTETLSDINAPKQPEAAAQAPATPAAQPAEKSTSGISPGGYVGEIKQFKQGPGVWNGSAWVPYQGKQ
jgi:hypothetical protein